MIKVEDTCIKGRFNLINDEMRDCDNDKYIRQLSRDEVRTLRNSCNDVLEDKMNRAELFLIEIKQVCKKHKLSISHEDFHGSFKILKYNDNDMRWLLSAGEYWYDPNNDVLERVTK